MDDRFDAADFIRYLRSNRRGIAASCTLAAVLALSFSLLVQKRYTAVASVLIQPPAGTDPRGATAVSPVYLESLKTYELLAASDSIFAEALDKLRLRQKYADRSIESLKRSVLAVSKPVNTRVIQISATLPDPTEAQQLARYIAERSVAISRSMDEQAGAGVLRETQAILDAAQARLDAARKAVAEVPGHQTSASDAAARSAIANLASELANPDSSSRRVGTLVERLARRRDFLEAELDSAWTAYDTAVRKRDDARTNIAYQGERLIVLDPGIVPQRPSFPNTSLNLIGALLISLVGSVLWLALRFGTERRATAREPEYLRR